MDIILYFAFGVLNIGLFYLYIKMYKRFTGVDFEIYDKIEKCMNLIAYFITGPFGTMILMFLGLFLFGLWRKHYRKK